MNNYQEGEIRSLDNPDVTMEVQAGVVPLSAVTDLELLHSSMRNKKAKGDYFEHSLARDDYETGWGSEWLGGLKSLDGAKGMATKGWGEGRKMLQSLRGVVTNDIEVSQLECTNARRVRRLSEDDGDFDYDRFKAGDDRYWWKTQRTARGLAPVVSLVFGWGGLADKTAQQLLWAGASASIVSDLLEDAGYSVEVLAMNLSRQNPHKKGSEFVQWASATCIQLKAPDRPMHPGALALACHGGLFRTFGFAWKKTCRSYIGSGFGSTMNPAKWDLSVLAEKVMSGEKHVIMPTAYSKSQAIAAIKEAVGKFVYEK